VSQEPTRRVTTSAPASQAANFTAETCEDGVASGIPGEDMGDIKDAGRVIWYPSEIGPQDVVRFCTFSQGAESRAGDRFGAALGRFAVVASVSAS
jgi:hypothetical protein